MGTARTFAYNTGSPIAGTEQFGDLAVGVPSAGYPSTGLKWWNGPDEDPGYVVGYAAPSGRMGADGVTGYVGFQRTLAKTEGAFISLANSITGQSFTSGSEAKTWLNSNGYWTSYTGGGTPISGNWFLIEQYSPADNNGDITFPDHNTTSPSLNPNLIGQSGYAIYINGNDSEGNYKVPELNGLVGSSGTLTLTQGSNSVTYSFSDTAFNTLGNQFYWDDVQEGSPLNAITVVSAASGDFNTTTPITITITN